MVANMIALLISKRVPLSALLSFPSPSCSEGSKDDYVTQQAKLPRPIKLSARGKQLEKSLFPPWNSSASYLLMF